MRSIMITLFCALLLTVLCVPAFAHPAEKVLLKWEADTETLDVLAAHPVSNPARHYIVSIIVTVNGAKAAEKAYTAQTDPTGTHERFVLSGIKAGAVIEVTTRCNVSGTLKETITL